jgi:ORF6N domain
MGRTICNSGCRPARLYEVHTKTFNQAVKRNRECFPDDFAFQVYKSELEHWRSQFCDRTVRWCGPGTGLLQRVQCVVGNIFWG